jgi:DNA-binding IclR family transcriptional regulator
MSWAEHQDDPMDAWPTPAEVKFMAMLGALGDPPTALELTEPSGLSRVSVHRVLRELFGKRLVERCEGGEAARWRLSERGQAIVAAAREVGGV